MDKNIFLEYVSQNIREIILQELLMDKTIVPSRGCYIQGRGTKERRLYFGRSIGVVDSKTPRYDATHISLIT